MGNNNIFFLMFFRRVDEIPHLGSLVLKFYNIYEWR